MNYSERKAVDERLRAEQNEAILAGMGTKLKKKLPPLPTKTLTLNQCNEVKARLGSLAESIGHADWEIETLMMYGNAHVNSNLNLARLELEKSKKEVESIFRILGV